MRVAPGAGRAEPIKQEARHADYLSSLSGTFQQGHLIGHKSDKQSMREFMVIADNGPGLVIIVQNCRELPENNHNITGMAPNT